MKGPKNGLDFGLVLGQCKMPVVDWTQLAQCRSSRSHVQPNYTPGGTGKYLSTQKSKYQFAGRVWISSKRHPENPLFAVYGVSK